MSRVALAIACCLLVASVNADQISIPHPPQANTQAKAAEMKANLNTIVEASNAQDLRLDALEELGGGCSATQQTNSVLIECADGSSGVLAAGGTVLIFPEAVLGETPDPISIPSGEFVVLDDDDQLLGGYHGDRLGYYKVSLQNIGIGMRNDEATESVQLAESPAVFFYSELDCQGAKFIDARSDTFFLFVSPDHDSYIRPYEALGTSFVSRSRKSDASTLVGVPPWGPWTCTNIETIHSGGGNLSTFVEVTMPGEITDAAYPIRVALTP